MATPFTPLTPLLLGDHIKVRLGAYEHHGIHLGGGVVVHFSGAKPAKSAASVRLGSLEQFAGRAGVAAIEVVAYSACLEPDVVVARARSLLGRVDYHVLRNNCEQCARWCKTGEFVSSQVERAKAAGGGVAAATGATVAAVGLVSATGVVAGTSGAGLMSGLASTGAVVGGGAAVGVAVLAAAPAAVAAVATHQVFRDDAALDERERLARRSARIAGKVGAAAGTLGTVAAVSAAGVPGLSAVGISSGLAALGGSMVGGLVVAFAAPAALAAGVAYAAYRLTKSRGP
ncbi:MAG: lecithin retinol acyltransferase family protein [Polyangiaceae bacterium]|nr:lecithin retinol acyltransferase family protein [Polyangiaceae bacterium]